MSTAKVERYPITAQHHFVKLRRSRQRVHGLEVYVDAFGRRVVFS